MELAARTAAWGGWVNPYVTDGLVSMFDAEWNAGRGVHSSSIDGLYDLATNKFYEKPDNAVIEVGSASMILHSLDQTAIFRWILEVGVHYDDCTIELVDTNHATGRDDNGETVIGIYGVLIVGNKGTDKPIIKANMINGQWAYSYYYASGLAGNKRYQCATNQDARITIGSNTYNMTTWWKTSVAQNNIYQIRTQPNGHRLEIHSYRMYNRILTASEVAHNYAIDKARFGLP